MGVLDCVLIKHFWRHFWHQFLQAGFNSETARNALHAEHIYLAKLVR